jgi:predicted dehydrogenase
MDEVLHDKSIDAVVITTPAESHYAYARDALKHGKHVLVEKPMTTSVGDAETLVCLADRMGLTLRVRCGRFRR